MNRWPLTIEVPVQWGEQDALGHVNNVVYLRWFESARLAYWDRIGVRVPRRIGPILARQTIDYRKPLVWPDDLRVSATVSRIGNTSFVMGQRIQSRANGWAVVAEGESTLVMLDYETNGKVPFPDDLRRTVEAYEASAPAGAAAGQAPDPSRT
jgi:acyl-CoA thioester hydrolase